MAYLILVRAIAVDDLHEIIPHVIIGLCSMFFLMAPFLPRYRTASWWIRFVSVLSAFIGLAYTVLGFFLLAHQHAGHSDLPRPQVWALSHLKSYLAGIAVGLLTALLINPELWRLTRHRPFHPNTWLESLIKP